MASEWDDSKQGLASGVRTAHAVPVPRSRESVSRYEPGEVIGNKYRLGQRLGEGGMGDVWLAHNETLDIDVALKLIRGELATPEMAERLLHEARAAARLGHPAIVRINDFGKTALGDPFIVMELLEGEDLAAALAARGRLTAVTAVRTLLPIAHALMVAHNKGIVHRDLKPENVFLAKGDDGKLQPKLVDFGVAKLERVEEKQLTQSREVVGSPLYMSPEQARGDEVDHRADVWAFAVVLYEAITGRAPFEGKNYNSLLYAIIANPPTPSVDLGGGDAELWAILERGVRKEADQRWFSMRDFGEALAHWLEDRDVHDDVTGASLTATWLDWKKESDELEPRPAWGEDGARVSPHPALPALQELRARVETIRKPRKSKSRNLVALGVVFFGVLLAAILTLSQHSTTPRVQAAAAPPAPAIPVVANAPPPPDPQQEAAHERAVEEALESAAAPPTPSASATPTFVTARPVEHFHAVRPRADVLSHGIHVVDPYGSSMTTHQTKAGRSPH